MTESAPFMPRSFSPGFHAPAQAAFNDDGLLEMLRASGGGGPRLGGAILKRLLGSGATSNVYLGLHAQFGIEVAVKVLKLTHPISPILFLREARYAALIDHPNLVRVFDAGRDPHSQLYFMVMEYVAGCSALQALSRSLGEGRGPLAASEALRIVMYAARAAGVAHWQGIVHRDIKPENILLRERDQAVKLADLGVAVPFENEPRQQSNIQGTPGFVAPEVLLGSHATPAADVYALGVTLYELATGRLPFGELDGDYAFRQLHETPAATGLHGDWLDADAEHILLRALHRDPASRFADGSAFAAALKNVRARIRIDERPGVAAGAVDSGGARAAPVVMCVDDDAGLLDIVGRIIGANEMTPLCFSDPREALQQAAAINPDAAVVDLKLPHMDGVELCRRFREIQGCEDLGVLMLSGANTDCNRAAALRGGLSAFLAKPIVVDDLLLRLRLLTQLRATKTECLALELRLATMRGERLKG